MYCEIDVKHRDAITWQGLQDAIGRGHLGREIPVEEANKMSAIYKSNPPLSSLFAFETTSNCFVIVRRVNDRTSTYHLEGSRREVTVDTLFRAAQEYSESLLRKLRTHAEKGYRGRSLAARLFEDNARETGVEGKLVTLASAFRKKFNLSELLPNLATLVTAWLLIHFGLKQEPRMAAVVTFVTAVIFKLSEVFLDYYRGRGTIEWKLKQA